LKQELARSRETSAAEAKRHGEAVQSYLDRLQRCEDQVEFERSRASRHRRVEEQLAARDAEIKDLQRERDQLREESATLRATGMAVVADIGKDRVAELQHMQAGLLNKYHRAVEESQVRQSAEEELRAKLVAARAAGERLWEERVSLQKRVAELEASYLLAPELQDSQTTLDQHQALKEEVAVLRAQLQEERGNKQHLQDTLSERERACKGLSQESEFLKSQCAALNAKLQQAQEEATARGDKVGRCLQCENNLESMRSLEEKMLDLKGQLRAVQQEREIAVAENRKLRKGDETCPAREELQRQLQALEKERLELVADSEKLQRGDREHVERAGSLEGQLQNVQGQLQEARSEHAEMAAEKARLKAWGDQQLADVRLLEGQLEDSRARLRVAQDEQVRLVVRLCAEQAQISTTSFRA